MSSRPGVGVRAVHPADGGESPNCYFPFVTVDLRVFWPPLATDQEIEAALSKAIEDARYAIAVKREGS